MRFVFGAIFILTVHLICFIRIAGNNLLMVDENYHYDQILRFIKSDYTLNPGLSMLPGYHVILMTVVNIFQTRSLYDIRIICLVLNLVFIPVFYLLAKKINRKRPLLLTMQYSFLPIMFPFYSLVYTDIFSAGLVILSLWLVAMGNATSGGLFALFSLLVKQTNIVWFFFINLIACRQPISILKTVKRSWLFIAGYLLFGIFVILNGGVATGAKEYMGRSLFNFGNLYLMLFIFFFLFLPHNLSNVGKIAGLFGRRRKNILIVTALLLFFAFYLATFVSSHPWNQYPYFLHNRIVLFFTSRLLLKVIFFLPVAFSLLSLYATRLSSKIYYFLYPLAIISLLPSWLIEVRYYFIPYTLFLLFKKDDALRVEIITFVLYFTSSLYLFYGTAQGWFFW